LDLLVHTARLWRSLGHHDSTGRFRIDGVTGPDEYSAVADNNVYTNLMAQENLFAAAEAAALHRERASELGVDDEEMTSWREAAASMVIPYDQTLGVHPQADGFTGHEIWDFADTTAEQYPLLLHFPYFDLYRKQVVKQADLVLAMQLHPDAFTQEQKARNFAYYDQLTVRDSSLSACVQAVIAAEIGHLDLAEDYLAEAALIDLDDLEHNTTNGLHMASLGGIWIALVAGYGGMRHTDAALKFTPRLPPALTRLAFGLHLSGRTLRVEVSAAAATYSIDNGKPLQLLHYGQPVHVSEDQPATCPIPDMAPLGPRPTQPPGRAPHRHHPTGR
jgi:alpha,alpha-trehalose phosphorylase